MTDFHAIVKGSRLTTACQHWQSMCQIIYYCPFFQQHSFLNWADIFSLYSQWSGKCAFHHYCSSVCWVMSPCVCGVSLRQHSNQKVAALELTVVLRIAKPTLASWKCHITSGLHQCTILDRKQHSLKLATQSSIKFGNSSTFGWWTPYFHSALCRAHLFTISIVEQVIL